MNSIVDAPLPTTGIMALFGQTPVLMTAHCHDTQLLQ